MRANWPIIFRFEEDDATDVGSVDYHQSAGSLERRRLTMTMKNPPHPGRSVRHDCIEPLGLTITEAAAAPLVTRQTLNNRVNGKSGSRPTRRSASIKGSPAAPKPG